MLLPLLALQLLAAFSLVLIIRAYQKGNTQYGAIALTLFLLNALTFYQVQEHLADKEKAVLSTGFQQGRCAGEKEAEKYKKEARELYSRLKTIQRALNDDE